MDEAVAFTFEDSMLSFHGWLASCPRCEDSSGGKAVATCLKSQLLRGPCQLKPFKTVVNHLLRQS